MASFREKTLVILFRWWCPTVQRTLATTGPGAELIPFDPGPDPLRLDEKHATIAYQRGATVPPDGVERRHSRLPMQRWTLEEQAWQLPRER